jgi:hypothetical protein
VRARACECVCVGVWESGRVGVFICVDSYSLTYKRATPMRHSELSFVASLDPPYFSTLFHKRYDFRKKLLNIKGMF